MSLNEAEEQAIQVLLGHAVTTQWRRNGPLGDRTVRCAAGCVEYDQYPENKLYQHPEHKDGCPLAEAIKTMAGRC